jgi:RNA polymerase sigma factor (sigma-70 family)
MQNDCSDSFYNQNTLTVLFSDHHPENTIRARYSLVIFIVSCCKQPISLSKRYIIKPGQDLLSADELMLHIRECALNNRSSQKKIYGCFYGYAMAICDRYTNRQEDALEILNDGFLKVFREIHHFSPAYADVNSSFKGWLRKIMIYTAIDYFRKYNKHQALIESENGVLELPGYRETPLDKMSYEEIIRSIQQLSPGYRTVLNLFIVEGLSHEEISNQLGISVGTSKSNLAKARRQLQKILQSNNQIEYKKNAV